MLMLSFKNKLATDQEKWHALKKRRRFKPPASPLVFISFKWESFSCHERTYYTWKVAPQHLLDKAKQYCRAPPFSFSFYFSVREIPFAYNYSSSSPYIWHTFTIVSNLKWSAFPLGANWYANTEHSTVVSNGFYCHNKTCAWYSMCQNVHQLRKPLEACERDRWKLWKLSVIRASIWMYTCPCARV